MTSVHSRSQDFELGGGGGQTTNYMQWRHGVFSKEELLWDKDIVEWKTRSCGLLQKLDSENVKTARRTYVGELV